MATLVLTAAGGALGAALGGGIGGSAGLALGQALGAAAGGVAGGLIDQAVLGGGSRVVDVRAPGPVPVMGAREGAPIARVAGRMRVAGHVIWASRFREETVTSSSRAGKGAPTVRTRERRFSVSLAVALCEGPVERIGRVWADGRLLPPEAAELRLHRGGEDQAPDPLIEAIEGPGRAPAYRGLAYMVFEELALAPFGGRVPQISVEVFRQPVVDPALIPGGAPPLSTLVEAVALSPGSGEFSLETEPVRERLRPGVSRTLNVNSPDGRADALVALDQLQAAAPQCRAASLVVSWFGDDLRCGACAVRPRAEEADKRTEPVAWEVGGMGRGALGAVGRRGGRPVYGGTPSDRGVIASIREMRRRGIDVMFYPFVLMDVPEGNALPDPYGGAGQAAYPWRGRITLDLAPGLPGGADGTPAAAEQVARFFGQAGPQDFARREATVRYTGPEEWGFRRFILHYAHLCALAGGVSAFCIGSELRGLTWIRDGAGEYPAVRELRRLARDVRTILGPAVRIGYAADWSEYFGHQPADGSGDVFFHLDPLWSDEAIDFIGIDNYMPLSDWRDGPGHADAAAGSPYALNYLKSNVEGGEGFDWFYASPEDRAAQRRTPITDGAFGEPWVFRYKDLRRWWSQPHYNRPGGVRDTEPTAWVPRSKPIWFTEIGCPAVDKGANQPNVFLDPKSAESALPHFSSGARDETMQRRFLQAALDYWRDDARNPASDLYDGRMVDVARSFVWTWDLRPWPDFPQRLQVWSDGENHRLGHWITGRLGGADLAEVVAEICLEAGVSDVDVSRLHGVVEGFLREGTQTGRQALQTLMLAFAFDAVESGGRLRFLHRDGGPVAVIAPGDCVDQGGTDGPRSVTLTRGPAIEAPRGVRVGYRAADADYAPAAAQVLAAGGGTDRVDGIELPLAMSDEAAAALAERWAFEAGLAREEARFVLPPSRMALEPGDIVRLGEGGAATSYRLERVADGAGREATARSAERPGLAAAAPPPRPAPALWSREPVEVVALEVATPWEEGAGHGPLVAAFADPWPGPVGILATGPTGELDETLRLERPAVMGRVAAPLPTGVANRWMRGAQLIVELFGGALRARAPAEVLNGANAAAIETGDGGWEVLQFAEATLVGPRTYALGLLLRGQSGGATPGPIAEGARFVLLDGAAKRLPVTLAGIGAPQRLRVGPERLAVDDPAFTEVVVTPTGALLVPLATTPLRLRRTDDGGFRLAWARRSRAGFGAWGPVEPPPEIGGERYRVRMLRAAVEQSRHEVAAPRFDLPADVLAQGPIELRVAQLSAQTGPGPETRIVIDG